MKTRCYSYNESCPCCHCEKSCCQDMDITDTDELCKEAKEHCEKCALENGEPLKARWQTMSDYISKSALIEQIKLYEKELSEDRKLGVDSDDEMMLFAIANQETAIYRIKRCIEHELPTVDEKEIIRKTVERIIRRLEKHKSDWNYDYNIPISKAIEIVKEEGGIE